MFKGVEVEEQALLAPYTTLHIGGPAQYLAFPKNQNELLGLLQEAKARDMPVYLLGGGSNHNAAGNSDGSDGCRV